MAANGRGNMRPAGRSPPFLAIGLFVALVILGFNYWSLSSRNGEQANEIVLLESELRLVNAKKTSAEKRSEAISDKVTELEAQINNQKEAIAKTEADRAYLEKEKLSTIERNNELENEVRGFKDQQLPACEADKRNLQQEVEQLRADIEVHKNKQCGRSDCETFINKERDALIEDMYKVVGALPLISMYRSNIKLGSYHDQIAKLASQMDQDALKKQEVQQQQQQQQPMGAQQQQQQVDTQQQQPSVDGQQQQQQASVDNLQQQAPVDGQQQQQAPVDGQQQQQAPVDGQQQQAPVDNLQQQAPVDGQQQQQAPVDNVQQQAPVDGQQQQQAPVDNLQQQAPVDTQQQQQQAPVDNMQQQTPVDQQQQQTADAGAQPADQNQQGVGPAPVMNQDSAADTGFETNKDTSNMNDADTVKAMDADRVQDAGPGAAGDGNALTDDAAAANGADDNYDDEDDDRDNADDTLRVNKDEQEYDYDDADDDADENDDYDYDKKTDDLKKEENGIDTMFQNDRKAAETS